MSQEQRQTIFCKNKQETKKCNHSLIKVWGWNVGAGASCRCPQCGGEIIIEQTYSGIKQTLDLEEN